MKNVRESAVHTWILALAAMSVSLSALGADPNVFATRDGAVRGTDVVSYFSLDAESKRVKGSDEFTLQWNGATWKFSTAQNRDLFEANPEKYAPQYGGYCAYAASRNLTKPVDPDAWEIVDGKLYLNLSHRVKRDWLKDVPGNIRKADANWPEVLRRCEKRGNCRK